MNGFELHGIDAPLIRRDLQAIENGWQGVVDMPAFVAVHDAASPVDQGQIFLETEQNAALKFVRQPAFEGKQRFEWRCEIQ